MTDLEKFPIPDAPPNSTRATNAEIELMAKNIANPPPSILMRRDVDGGVTVVQGAMRLRASLETTGEARARDIDTGESFVLKMNGNSVDVFAAEDVAVSQESEKKRGPRPR